MNNLNCDELCRTLSTGVTLLDVSTTNEFNHGGLPNAKNIPLASLPLFAQQHFERDEPVLIYCHSGSRAIIAEKILASLGFTDVTNMDGIHHYQHCL